MYLITIVALCLISLISASNVDKTDLLFLNDCLDQHNHYRKIHDVSVVGYSVDLIHVAQRKAEAFAAGNKRDFDDPKYGTNSAWNPGTNIVNCRSVVDGWYREIKYFNHKKAHYRNNAPHFTQLMWKSTTDIGCAQVSTNTPTPGVYTVCVYSPKGNNLEEIDDNISPKIKS